MAESPLRSIKSRIGLISTALAVLLLGLAWYYRDDIFQSFQDPGEPFQTYEKPIALNYADRDAWLSIPDLSKDPADHPTAGDVFVIAPTLYLGGEHWNMPADEPRRRADMQRIVRPNYVDVFDGSGRVFAPYYRQASRYTLMTIREDARRAQNLAYSDIRRAFAAFLKQSPPERPIILAGYAQGGSHLERLLSDFFVGNEALMKRLAAAYILDHPVPTEIFEARWQGLVPCESANDTNCVVAFGAFMPEDDVMARHFVDRLTLWTGRDYRIVNGAPLLCTNPLLWNLSTDYAPRRLHKGGIAAAGIEPGTRPAPLAKQTGAQCQDGILWVDRPKSRALRRPMAFGGKFRVLPSNLFYEDIRENAETRVQALLDKGTLPKRAQKLDDLDVIEIIDSPVTPARD